MLQKDIARRLAFGALQQYGHEDTFSLDVPRGEELAALKEAFEELRCSVVVDGGRSYLTVTRPLEWVETQILN